MLTLNSVLIYNTCGQGIHDNRTPLHYGPSHIIDISLANDPCDKS